MPGSNVIIRFAAKEDARLVTLMFERVYEVSYPGYQMTEETLSRAKLKVEGLIDQCKGFILVAAEANTNDIKGFIAADMVEFAPTGEAYPRIASLFVDPASRGRGVATQLKLAAEEELGS